MKTSISYCVEHFDEDTKEWEPYRLVYSLEKAEQILQKIMTDQKKSIIPIKLWSKVRILEATITYKLIKEIEP